jgi:DNA-binding response OmpR family regulator
MSDMHTQPTEGDQRNSKTILVVEDDASVGELLTLAISQETPFKALLVLDGFEALQFVHEYKPSLFILDYNLPDINGIALYDRLHALKELAGTPAVLISANLPQRELATRQLTGLRKPFDLNQLLETIERLVG